MQKRGERESRGYYLLVRESGYEVVRIGQGEVVGNRRLSVRSLTNRKVGRNIQDDGFSLSNKRAGIFLCLVCLHIYEKIGQSSRGWHLLPNHFAVIFDRYTSSLLKLKASVSPASQRTPIWHKPSSHL